MGHIDIGSILTPVFAGFLLLILLQRRVRDALLEGINNFRGGPPTTPMHPSPVNDGALLRRRPAAKSARTSPPLP
jgi:hypothetical protein